VKWFKLRKSLIKESEAVCYVMIKEQVGAVFQLLCYGLFVVLEMERIPCFMSVQFLITPNASP